MEYKSGTAKISDIVKKWKRLAAATSSSAGSSKKKSVIKRTFSFSDAHKGRVSVSVGKEGKRYAVPTEYLGHQAFRVLLREAEEEFGFQQEGVLRIPCEVAAFERILKAVGEKTASDHDGMVSDDEEEEEQHHQYGFPASPVCGSGGGGGGFFSPVTSSPDSDQYSSYGCHQQQHHPAQICR
ncbi:Auxin-responsive protein SAUR71 [Linum perenne]